MSEQATSTQPISRESILRETFPLGAQWPTIDPFLFVAHHRDSYPAGRGDFGPDAPLDGRELGSDFADKDGWNMYHGTVVPGFPQHPHRGFETITYVRRGVIDHADSLGAAARYGNGDTQWMTAGSGIVHSEMFPLRDSTGTNPAELFQIWLNLPSSDKTADPAFKMFWADQTPVVESVDENGRRVAITVIAGDLHDARPPSPPPDSWAAKDDAEVAIWHARLEPGAKWAMPATRGDDTSRVLYLFEGDHVIIGGERLDGGHGALVSPHQQLDVVAGETAVEFLVLQGRPIAEPIARYGPFVMNDNAGIQQAFDDYRSTGFGGWPWPSDGPVHDNAERFARHPNGETTHPAAK
jgi:redox-sensitive bicupin YhaK (pirin superfamily)